MLLPTLKIINYPFSMCSWFFNASQSYENFKNFCEFGPCTFHMTYNKLNTLLCEVFCTFVYYYHYLSHTNMCVMLHLFCWTLLPTLFHTHTHTYTFTHIHTKQLRCCLIVWDCLFLSLSLSLPLSLSLSYLHCFPLQHCWFCCGKPSIPTFLTYLKKCKQTSWREGWQISRQFKFELLRTYFLSTQISCKKTRVYLKMSVNKTAREIML